MKWFTCRPAAHKAPGGFSFISGATLLSLCLFLSPPVQAEMTTSVTSKLTTASDMRRLPPAAAPGESLTTVKLPHGIRALVQTFSSDRPSTHIVFYLLPNGNTLEETFGRTETAGLDWHYYIQHAGAQARRLVELAPNAPPPAFIYLEADGLSWPRWRRDTPDANTRIAETLAFLRAQYAPAGTATLVAHSGGGSFLHGVIEATPAIPSWITTFAFLDANYSFDAALHGPRLLDWLTTHPGTRLRVAAYDDRHIAINGKPVVGPDGGTWRATWRMSGALDPQLKLQVEDSPDAITSTALSGRVVLKAVKNPENRILHTVLVEKNGMIWGVLPAPTASDDLWTTPQAYRRHITPTP